MANVRRSPLWPNSTETPRFGTVQVNRAHILGMGLVQYHALNERGGNISYNLVGSLRNLLFTAGATLPTWHPRGLSFDAGDEAKATAVARAAFPLSIAGNALTNTVAAGAMAIITQGQEADDAQLVIGRSGSTAFYNNRAAGGGTLSSLTGGTISVGKFHTVVGVSAASNNHRLYLDGVFLTSGTTAQGTPAWNNVALGYLDRTTNSQWWNGIIRWAGIWARSLSDYEVAWLNAEPYCFLEPVIHRRYFVPAADGATWAPYNPHMQLAPILAQ